jgi:hypothetical protein
MGPNPSFFRFVKHVMRDSSKMSYIQAYIILLKLIKKKEVLTIHGGGEIEGSGSSFGKHYGSCLLSPLNMDLFVSCLTVG